MVNKNCFAFKEQIKDGHERYTCTALFKMECENCKFFKTKQEYVDKVLNVLPTVYRGV